MENTLSHISKIKIIESNKSSDVEQKLQAAIDEGWELSHSYAACDGMGVIHQFQVLVKLKEKEHLLNE